METRVINGILCRRVMPGEVIKAGDLFDDGSTAGYSLAGDTEEEWDQEFWLYRPAITLPTGIEARVCADIAERQRNGIAKYGTTLADNPLSRRERLQHAYEEALDLAVYLKKEIDAEA